jgi:SAM-dependent methyltransferase
MIFNKLFPGFFRKIGSIKYYNKYFIDKKGLEVGGPSEIFQYEIPIYNVINKLDGCNFSTKTIWEGELIEGNNYKYIKNKKGYQYISEASRLVAITDEKYDFLIASHCLEHCANPLKTVEEWLRVIKCDGIIMLILPHKDFTFDHNRKITSFNHLLEDYKKNIGEDDLTHLQEILDLHDLKMDVAAGTKEDFKKRCLDNFNNRCLHHHVYDSKLLEEVFNFFNIQVLKQDFVKPYHQIILGKKAFKNNILN